jgi:hypothetical protein
MHTAMSCELAKARIADLRRAASARAAAAASSGSPAGEWQATTAAPVKEARDVVRAL